MASCKFTTDLLTSPTSTPFFHGYPTLMRSNQRCTCFPRAGLLTHHHFSTSISLPEYRAPRALNYSSRYSATPENVQISSKKTTPLTANISLTNRCLGSLSVEHGLSTTSAKGGPERTQTGGLGWWWESKTGKSKAATTFVRPFKVTVKLWSCRRRHLTPKKPSDSLFLPHFLPPSVKTSKVKPLSSILHSLSSPISSLRYCWNPQSGLWLSQLSEPKRGKPAHTQTHFPVPCVLFSASSRWTTNKVPVFNHISVSLSLFPEDTTPLGTVAKLEEREEERSKILPLCYLLDICFSSSRLCCMFPPLLHAGGWRKNLSALYDPSNSQSPSLSFLNEARTFIVLFPSS